MADLHGGLGEGGGLPQVILAVVAVIGVRVRVVQWLLLAVLVPKGQTPLPPRDPAQLPGHEQGHAEQSQATGRDNQGEQADGDICQRDKCSQVMPPRSLGLGVSRAPIWG